MEEADEEVVVLVLAVAVTATLGQLHVESSVSRCSSSTLMSGSTGASLFLACQSSRSSSSRKRWGLEVRDSRSFGPNSAGLALR